jgi:phage tail-like protein
MDVNGLPMWLIAGRRAFGLAEDSAGPSIASNLDYQDAQGHVRLSQQQDAPQLAEDETFARRMASSPSTLCDALGSFAWWDAGGQRLEASGFGPGAIELPLPASDPPTLLAPTDVALGADEVVYAARDGAVVMKDLRDRWHPAEARREGYRAGLVAPMPDGGAWAFDIVNRRLARVKGRPLRFTGLRDVDPGRFDPVEPNRDPPRLVPVRRGTIPTGFTAVAMAASPAGRLALLAWATGADAAVFSFEEEGFVLRFRLAGLRFPFSLAWSGEAEIAVLASDGGAVARQAFVYPMDLPAMPDTAMRPDGRIHPLIQTWPGKFCNGLAETPQYLVAAADSADPDPASVRPLRPFSGAYYAREGSVLVGPVDSRLSGCVWHRLYIEAAVPSGAAIEIAALATETDAAPALPGAEDAPAWAIHRLATTRDLEGSPDIAHASWCAASSEIPFAPPALACPPRPGSAGLFTLLLQQPGRKVRRVAGRYLWLHLRFTGDSQGSPELAAIRAYARRFSYRDRYLPAFYRETLGGGDAIAAGAATSHDFMERLLCLFEGVLTETEGRIAGAWLLTDPSAAPDAALPWIGQWIGISAGDGASRLRQSLLAAPHTAALNGTLGGLMAALEIGTGGIFVSGGRLDPGRRAPPPGTPAVARLGDVALRALMLSMQEGGQCAMLTGGAVTRGDIVVVEGYRLRRTFATILGTDLADEEDPLTLGLAASGNSFVGDTLILGDQARAELLALFRSEIDRSRGDTEAVAEFYARLAHRVLVLVRGVADPSEMQRLRDLVEENIPAHVEPQVHQARDPLVVGAASLVGIDSFLAEAVPFERVQIGQTVLGGGDLVAGSGRLDRRADGPVSRPPTARADAPREVWSGTNFTVSAARSSAQGGREITRHIWTWES